MPELPAGIRLRHTIAPGDLGMIVHLHGVQYAREYGLDTTFEPYVAKPLADFLLAGNGPLWIAENDERMLGSIAVIDDAHGTGQLRWFLLVPEARGLGLGRRMLEEAIGYCRTRGMRHMFLWTFADLTDALRLYQRAGFSITEEKMSNIWGGPRRELRMDLSLVPAAGA
jgi:GNAT superfamily N-acetyltransferase